MIYSQAAKTLLDNDILNCEELRPLWVVWEDDGVRFGKGFTPGAEELLFLDDDSPIPVNAISLGGEHELIKWEFHRSMGEYGLKMTSNSCLNALESANAEIKCYKSKIRIRSELVLGSSIFLGRSLSPSSGNSTEVWVGRECQTGGTLSQNACNNNERLKENSYRFAIFIPRQ